MAASGQPSESVLPILPGLYPDPSICRAGDTCYVVNSSFEYLPGLPLHSSTDLVNWTPVGNALGRPTQVTEHAGMGSSGIYAPTIRHHDGRFWIVGTNILDLGVGLGHFIIHADDPAGPWSDPVHVPGTMGIDPDLMWDDEGVCRLTWGSFAPELRGIVSAPIEPSTGALLEEPKLLWQGTGLAHAEGPHLYRIDGWWYLLLAEGGTERGHTSSIARARSLEGPFEPAPNNPILTHRSTTHPVQSAGHADLVQLADGSWAAVHLGVRPRGRTPSFHVNGRETFLVGVDWVDGWPVIDETRFLVNTPDHSFTDRFEAGTLDQRWLGVGQFPSTFTRPGQAGGLVIDADSGGPGRPMLTTRLPDVEWSAEAEFDATGGSGRFVVRIDDKHSYGLTFDGESVEATLAIGPVQHSVGRVPVPRGTIPTLRISARLPERGLYVESDEPDLIELAVIGSDGLVDVLGAFDGRYLSSEVAGGFTGRVLGIEAITGRIVLNRVRYSTGITAND
jgi:xylan 1,4-beta-xylosidase